MPRVLILGQIKKEVYYDVWLEIYCLSVELVAALSRASNIEHVKYIAGR